MSVLGAVQGGGSALLGMGVILVPVLLVLADRMMIGARKVFAGLSVAGLMVLVGAVLLGAVIGVQA